MGQHANSNRQATLDDKKRRAAGRAGSKGMNPLRDDHLEPPAKGKTGGASGRDKANPKGANRAAGQGGGGGYSTRDAAAAINVGRSTRPARKRG